MTKLDVALGRGTVWVFAFGPVKAKKSSNWSKFQQKSSQLRIFIIYVSTTIHTPCTRNIFYSMDYVLIYRDERFGFFGSAVYVSMVIEYLKIFCETLRFWESDNISIHDDTFVFVFTFWWKVSLCFLRSVVVRMIVMQCVPYTAHAEVAPTMLFIIVRNYLWDFFDVTQVDEHFFEILCAKDDILGGNSFHNSARKPKCGLRMVTWATLWLIFKSVGGIYFFTHWLFIRIWRTRSPDCLKKWWKIPGLGWGREFRYFQKSLTLMNSRKKSLRKIMNSKQCP